MSLKDNTKETFVVFYHANCQDGLFSAYNFWKKYGEINVIYIPVSYADVIDIRPLDTLELLFKNYIENDFSISQVKHSFKDNKVTLEDYKSMNMCVLDYSFPVDHFIKHTELFKSVLVLDHHATAITKYKKHFTVTAEDVDEGIITIYPTCNSAIVFSTKESGAKLSYKQLNKCKMVPDFIELVSDRDLWSFKLKYTKAFNLGCKMFEPHTFSKLDSLINYSLTDILHVGELCSNSLNLRIKRLVKNNTIKIIVNLNGHIYNCALIDCYPDMSSDVCNYAIETDEYDIAIVYNVNKEARVECSVRSKKGLNSSDISLKFGGGGHEQASGFIIDYKDFSNILTSKLLEVIS